MFPNGSIDPWHALGIVKNVSSTEQAIFIEGNSQDIYNIYQKVFLNSREHDRTSVWKFYSYEASKFLSEEDLSSFE